jgi:ubiquinol-cytochrome c reductase cytochrome b subunit
VILGPILAFWVTRRVAISLQRADNERLLHGLETGVIMRSPDGEYTEKHQPIGAYEAYELTARDRILPHDIGPETDENGVRAPRRALNKLRAGLSRFYYADAVQKPTAQELEAAHAHAHDADEIHELTEETETYREVTSDRH